MKEKYCNDRADGDGGGSSGRGGNHRIIRLHKSADTTRQTESGLVAVTKKKTLGRLQEKPTSR